jgi:general secretion pathway protein J
MACEFERLRRENIAMSRAQKGFTLIELLVALAIFAILSLLSYRTLGSLFQTREQLNIESAKWRDAALFFSRVENDLAAVLNRPIRTADGRSAAPLCLASFATNDAALTFTRTGFADANGTSAAPQRIGYRLSEGNLEWLLWPTLDQAPRSVAAAYPALKNVRDAKWRALGNFTDNANWRAEWPQAPATCELPDPKVNVFPRALELTITLNSGETLTRIFSLRAVSVDGS